MLAAVAFVAVNILISTPIATAKPIFVVPGAVTLALPTMASVFAPGAAGWLLGYKTLLGLSFAKGTDIHIVQFTEWAQNACTLKTLLTVLS